jgi:UDP-N-acetylmuramate--alanine ligase
MQPAGTTASGALLYDDYAHHPTEVRATLAAARTLEPRRLVAVLGPHSFARARLMSREFGEALALADAALVLDVVPAGPDDGPPVSGQVIAGAARRAGCASVGWVRDIDAAEEHLRSTLGPGDLCVGLGPFGVDRLVERLAGASV